MLYNFQITKEGIKHVQEWLQKELASVRTGRAAPALLDGVSVESYGAKAQLAHVAAVSVQDPKTLLVSPWDKTQLKAIETALQAANLGVSAVVDGGSIRVIFPEVTVDRRKVLLKFVNEKTEEAKVTLRGERERVWSDIQKREKEGEMSEDDKFRLKDELQKMVDEGQASLLALADKKQKELES